MQKTIAQSKVENQKILFADEPFQIRKPKIDMLESMMLDTHFLNYFCEEDLGKGLKGAESHRSKTACPRLIMPNYNLITQTNRACDAA